MKNAETCTGGGTPVGELALTGPSRKAAAPGFLPVRGDLAHIRLAGQHFVPHYAVPMPFAVRGSGAALRSEPNADAPALRDMEAGSTFSVLDIADGWAWGERPGNASETAASVGYVKLDELEPAVT